MEEGFGERGTPMRSGKKTEEGIIEPLQRKTAKESEILPFQKQRCEEKKKIKEGRRKEESWKKDTSQGGRTKSVSPSDHRVKYVEQ